MHRLKPEAEEAEQIFVTGVGLQFSDRVNFDRWQRAGIQIAKVADSSAWCLGDWVVYGQERYIDRYREAIKMAGLDYQTLRNYAWVAKKFAFGRRRRKLSFQHHAEVASLSEEEQNRLLDDAERFKWSRNQLRINVRNIRNGPEGPKSTTVLPRFEVEIERLERYREAAERAHTSLEAWIRAVLDQASTGALSTYAQES